MRLSETPLGGVMLCEPRVFEDDRGLFFESYNEGAFSEAVGEPIRFVQDNHSHSLKNVLRGLHLQTRKPQGKLIRVTRGSIFDVAVDTRKDSPSFRHWFGLILDSKKHQQLWIPPGLAHGFLTLSESADVHYKVTDYYDPGFELSLRWDDPSVGVQWPATDGIVLSDKDRDAEPFDAVIRALSEITA